MTKVLIFAPSPILTVTVEEHPDGPDVHLHAGGQGVWQARMLRSLGIDVVMVSVLSGESGGVLRHLLGGEGIEVVAVERGARGATYIHDRRDGERIALVETGGDPIARHDLDELYGLTLREGLDSDAVILSGPHGEDALPPDVYRRLAADLKTAGKRVIVDLAGERLASALSGGVYLAKVSDEELRADGRAPGGTEAEGTDPRNTVEQIMAAMRVLHDSGAENVIVTRAHEPLLMLAAGEVTEVTTPTMQVADTTGAGDSLTAGVTAALAAGEPMGEAIILGAAAGALNVTRHGLGTGDGRTVDALRALVTTRIVDPRTEHGAEISPDQLAARTEVAE